MLPKTAPPLKAPVKVGVKPFRTGIQGEIVIQGIAAIEGNPVVIAISVSDIVVGIETTVIFVNAFGGEFQLVSGLPGGDRVDHGVVMAGVIAILGTDFGIQDKLPLFVQGVGRRDDAIGRTIIVFGGLVEAAGDAAGERPLIVEGVISHNPGVGEGFYVPDFTVAVERIAAGIDDFVAEDGIELAGANLQTVTNGNVHIDIRLIEIKVGNFAGVIAGGLIFNAVGRGEVVIRAEAGFDQAADIELFGIDDFLNTNGDLVELEVVADFFAKAGRAGQDENIAVLAALIVAEVKGVTRFKPAVDVDAEVLEWFCGADFIETLHDQTAWSAGILSRDNGGVERKCRSLQPGGIRHGNAATRQDTGDSH